MDVIVFKEREGCDGGGKGLIISDKAFTLTCFSEEKVCYSVDFQNLYINHEKSGTIQAKNEDGHSLNFINPILKAKDV